MQTNPLKVTSKTKFTRTPKRGSFDREKAYQILDSTPMCHVSYLIDGEPYITPTLQWRTGNDLYWHGSSASRFLKAIEGKPVAINVMLLDGLVLARSAFHHSANYRSVTLFGDARKLEPGEKRRHLEEFVEDILPGRWNVLRPMSNQEVRATTIFTIPIEEASVKVRDGMPIDDDEDYELPIWAGVIPISQIVGEPISDTKNIDGLKTPEHVFDFSIG
tara:strand:- start:5362 stop:6015 length:654 start_codon:yes stop_codon:yes gene_type:complete